MWSFVLVPGPSNIVPQSNDSISFYASETGEDIQSYVNLQVAAPAVIASATSTALFPTALLPTTPANRQQQSTSLREDVQPTKKSKSMSKSSAKDWTVELLEEQVTLLIEQVSETREIKELMRERNRIEQERNQIERENLDLKRRKLGF